MNEDLFKTLWVLCSEHDWHYLMSEEPNVYYDGAKREASMEHIILQGGISLRELKSAWKKHALSAENDSVMPPYKNHLIEDFYVDGKLFWKGVSLKGDNTLVSNTHLLNDILEKIDYYYKSQ